MHRSSRARILAPAALFLCLAIAPPAAIAAEEGTVTYTHESLPAFQQQLAAGQVQAVTFNKRVRSMHVTLKNGQHMLVKYNAHEQPTLAATLTAKHVPVTVLKPSAALAEAKKAPVHHKLRYIVGGIVIAVIVIVGAVLLVNRRRNLAAE